MRTITIDAPTCALCKKTLVGQAVELESGKRLHEQCLEDAAELGLKNALNMTRWDETGSDPTEITGVLVLVDGGEEEADEPEPVKPPFTPQLMRPGKAREIVEKAVASVQAGEAKPEPAGESFVSATDRAVEFLKAQLANGERLSSEVNAAAKAEGHTTFTLPKARKILGIERRILPDGRWATRLPGETRLITLLPAPAEPESIPASEESIPDKATPEPLTAESYVRRRDALGMTDAILAHWLENVGEAALNLYAGGKNLIDQDAARRVEALLRKMEGETNEARLAAYRNIYEVDEGVTMAGATYTKVG